MRKNFIVHSITLVPVVFLIELIIPLIEPSNSHAILSWPTIYFNKKPQLTSK